MNKDRLLRNKKVTLLLPFFFLLTLALIAGCSGEKETVLNKEKDSVGQEQLNDEQLDNEQLDDEPLHDEQLDNEQLVDEQRDDEQRDDEQGEDGLAIADSKSIESQLQLLLQNKDIWITTMDYANDAYNYAVTDLDHNGRLEIIASNSGGTGLYTYTQYYEINESYDGISLCETNYIEGDSQPDVPITKETLAFYDAVADTTYYIFYDFLKAGPADYYDGINSISLQNGKIVDRPLGMSHTSYATGEEEITYETSDQILVDEETFHQIPDQVYADLQPQKATFGWLTFLLDKKIENLTDEEILDSLKTSYESFTVADK